MFFIYWAPLAPQSPPQPRYIPPTTSTVGALRAALPVYHTKAALAIVTPSPTPVVTRKVTPKPRQPAVHPTTVKPAQQGSGSHDSVTAYIQQVFGPPYAEGALAIARCESGYAPNAWNPTPIGNSHASGVFQILYPSTWSTTSYRSASPYDWQANILAAHEIFVRDGYSWREWACRP